MPNQPQAPDDPLDPDLIRRQVGRILVSPDFRAAPKLSAFLTFVVERTAQGRPETLKAYAIATEALGHPTSFDSAKNSIVRVEAGRLRQCLARYYAGPGQDDPIVISMPTGRYVARFDANQAAVLAAPAPMPSKHDDRLGDETAPPQAGRPVYWMCFNACLAVLALATGLGLALTTLIGAFDGAPSSMSRLTNVRTADREPALSVSVSPIVNRTGGAEFDAPAAMMQPALNEALERFDHLAAAGEEASPDRAVLRLDGWIEARPFPTLVVSLVDRTTNRTVWTYSRRTADDAGRRDAVRSIATAIGRPDGAAMKGVVRMGLFPKRAARNACFYAFYSYAVHRDAPRHEAARACLEEEEAMGASVSGRALASMAQINIDEYRFGFNRRPDSDPLGEALGFARRAVDAAPNSPWASQSLCDALFFAGSFEEAMRHCVRARELNPFDLDVQAASGARLIALDRHEEGIALLEESHRVNSADPPWYDAYLFLGYWRKGNVEQAHKHVPLISSDPVSRIVRAVAAEGANHPKTAQTEIARLVATQPEIEDDPLEILRRHFPEPGLAEAVLASLTRAGLSK